MTHGLKLQGFQPQKPPPADLCSHLRKLAVKVVYAKYNRLQQPSTLLEISDKVRQTCQMQISSGSWKSTWKFPSKRTIDRRVNEACEPIWYDDDVPRLAAKTAGFYVPNPYRFKT